MATVIMPQLGESVTEGTVTRWIKQPNDPVALDEPLVEVDTEKVNVEIPSPFAGTLTVILVPEGSTVPVGTPIAEIAAAGEPAPPSARAEPVEARAPPPSPPPPSPPPPAPVEPAASPAHAEPVEARAGSEPPRHYSPVVLRLAEEAGIDLSTIPGTGSGGRVTRQDVEAAIARTQGAAPPAPPVRAAPVEARTGDTVVPWTPMRRAIADHMLRSKQSAAHAWLAVEVDVTGLVAARAAHKGAFRARESTDLTYLAFVARAVCQALPDHPRLNATWAGDQLIQRRDVNLGIAVNLPDGLIVPVIRHADRLAITALAHAIAGLAERARAGKLKLEEVQGSTFTLDNTGAFGSLYSGPIINSPEVAILTTESIVKRPVAVEPDAIAIRSIMNLCMSFDHRAMDGAIAIAFANRVKALLQAMDVSTPIY